MLDVLKAFALASCVFGTLLTVGMDASQGRWGAYTNSNTAWGGNGGSWGNTGGDWYGDNNYYYNNNYPYSQYYTQPGAQVEAGVDGSGYYFNVR